MKYKIKRTALIDADYIAYQQAAYAHSNQADVLELTERVQGLLAEWQQKAHATEAIAVFSCSREDNFRRDFYEAYKAHRTADPPAMLEAAKNVIQEAVKSIRMKRLEADDIMGILATNGRVSNPVIVSVDKDMRQIPGWHLNPEKEDFPVKVTELEADYTFFMQWLTGDRTDGFNGIHGVGEKKARKILNRGTCNSGDALTDWTVAALEAYRDAGESYEQALDMARCARILRNEDWDAPNRQPVLWVPPIPNPEEIWEHSEVGEDG